MKNKHWHVNEFDGVTVYLDKPREIKLTHKALKCFGKLTGVKLDNIDDAMKDETKLEALYYAMLSTDTDSGEDINVKSMEDILDTASPGYLMGAATKAIDLAYSEDDVNEEKAKDKGGPDEGPTGAAGDTETA